MPPKVPPSRSDDGVSAALAVVASPRRQVPAGAISSARLPRRLQGHRSVRLALIAIFLVGAFLRLGWLYADSGSISFAGLAEQNGDVARNIVVHDKWFVVNDASPAVTARLVDPADLSYTYADAHPRYRQAILEPPGPSLVLAGIWAVTGSERFIYLQALQLLIDSCMILLVYWLSMRLFRRRASALLAAGLYAVYLPAILLARIPHGDAWAGWITIASLALFVKARESARPHTWLAALGVLVGLGAYFRPNVMLLPVAFAIAVAFWAGWRRAIAYAALPVAIAALVLLPWTIRNYDVFHTFVPVRTSFGWTMWVGLGEVPNGFGDTGTDGNAVATVLRTYPNYVIGSPRFDKVLQNKSFAVIAAHPLFYAGLVGRRLLESTVVPPPSKAAASSRLASALAWAIPLLFVVAVVSAAVLARKQPTSRSALALLGATAVTTILPYVVIHLEARFLVAAAFVYLILTGIGVAMAMGWARRRILQRAMLRDPVHRT